MPVLAAVGEGEARRVGEAAGGAVDYFGHHRQRADGAGADARNQQELGKVPGPRVGRGGQGAVEAAQNHVAGPDVVMARHDEVGERGLGAVTRDRRLFQRRRFPRQPVRAELGQQGELRRAGGFGAAVGEVDDLALAAALDRGVGALDEAGQAFGQPVVAPRRLAGAVHA